MTGAGPVGFRKKLNVSDLELAESAVEMGAASMWACTGGGIYKDIRDVLH